MNEKYKGFLIPLLLVCIAAAGVTATILSLNSRRLMSELRRTRAECRTANLVKSITAWSEVKGSTVKERTQIELDISGLDLQDSIVKAEAVKNSRGSRELRIQSKITEGKGSIVKNFVITIQ